MKEDVHFYVALACLLVVVVAVFCACAWLLSIVSEMTFAQSAVFLVVASLALNFIESAIENGKDRKHQ